MSFKIVRYLLEADGTVPTFIQDGGYFPKGEELVGITIDSNKRHIPKSVKVLSRSALQKRVGLEIAEEFLIRKGMPDYE